MTTAEIETAANRGGLATSDFNIGQVLRSQVIPDFLEQVGPASWRKRYKTITTTAGTQQYNLDQDCLKVWEAYRLPNPPFSSLKYIGEDPLAVSLAESGPAQAQPTGYYIASTASTLSGSGIATFGAIADGAVGIQTFSLLGAVVGSNVAPGWPVGLPANLIGSMRVSATDTIEVSLLNMSGASITPGSLSFTFAVISGSQSSAIVTSGSGALTFGSIDDGQVLAQTFTLAGAVAGGNISPGWPSGLNTGIIGMMRVSATNTIEVRLLNVSGATITLGALTFSAGFIESGAATSSASWQAIKFQAPPDGAYSIQVVQLKFIPFGDTTTSINLTPYIPVQFHWALVNGLKAQIFFDRFGQGDPRYDRQQALYEKDIDKARAHRELGRRNYFVSVR